MVQDPDPYHSHLLQLEHCCQVQLEALGAVTVVEESVVAEQQRLVVVVGQDQAGQQHFLVRLQPDSDYVTVHE